MLWTTLALAGLGELVSAPAAAPTLVFHPPVLVGQAGAKAFGYADEGMAIGQHLWAPREHAGGPPWSNAPEHYTSSDGGTTWTTAPTTMPHPGSPITINTGDSEWPIRDLGHQLGFETEHAYPVGEHVRTFRSLNYTTYYGVKDGQWRWRQVNETGAWWGGGRGGGAGQGWGS